ncbi:glycerate kinase type-2 family protein [Hoeflea ulvae]|uniref:DUF4147 domain-containing protein n=1 Tax=Hoeflea ulvae TaxID=2983764 RepID=A0ABT3YMI7_9HYPH|nr:DUF4147 domain-containing protein [Hoeflea ulvae]MCY0097004.1 DUF4147 domain-containing protein [Hoeflea ulvae]
MFDIGVAAADPGNAVRQCLARDFAERPHPFSCIIAVGKAARSMAAAAMEAKAARFGAPVIVITNAGNTSALPGARVFAAGHPVPDENGLAATRTLLKLLTKLGARDHVLVLISGGASAMLPAPAGALSFSDEVETGKLLLASGADITAMNIVRQQISRTKGGGLARAAAPARVTGMILSDVVGDDLRIIGSGPTSEPAGTPGDALEILSTFGILHRVSPQVLHHLQTATTSLAVPECDNRLIGSNALSLAAIKAARPHGTLIVTPLTGDVSEAARRIAGDHAASNASLMIWGGETTVTVRGAGKGGRNQELCLRLAMKAERAAWKHAWCFLSGGTDGRDGPTDAAGGLVDGCTLRRIRDAGMSPQGLLMANDSYHALQASGDLLKTGATGTNVADIQMLLIHRDQTGNA